MADSVDRVFSHALNTVNKIRTGSQKPPSTTRLRLYGLYKQAMEGDVDGIMDRPEGNSEQDQRAREKWEAWKQQNNLSRTEAKRRYITTLIDTMHQYASPSPDSRELVAELEFVWDQVKSNVPSSSSSSPLQTLDQVGTGMSASYSALERQRATKDQDDDGYSDHANDHDRDHDQPLQIKSPMSQSEEDLEAAEADIDRDDEFVDAPDSQYALELYRQGAMDHNLSEANAQPPSRLPPSQNYHARTPLQQQSHSRPLSRRRPDTQPPTTPTPRPRMRTIIPQPIPLPPLYNTPPSPPPPPGAQPSSSKPSPADLKHRARIEASLMKLTAEVAALREQLEARRLFQHRPHYRFFRAVWRFVWAGVKHIAVDVLVLVVVLAWMRRRGERRWEGAVRVLLGDAVAQLKLKGGLRGKLEGLKGLPGLPGLPGLGGGGAGGSSGGGKG